MKSNIECLAMFCLLIMASQSFAQDVDEKTGLQFTYFGAAGWKISDNDVTVLIDPYISRLHFSGPNILMMTGVLSLAMKLGYGIQT